MGSGVGEDLSGLLEVNRCFRACFPPNCTPSKTGLQCPPLHFDITASRGSLEKDSKRLPQVFAFTGICIQMSDPKSKIIFLSLLKIFKVKRIRKPTLGNGAYLLLTCLKLWVSLPWLGLSLTCLLFRFCQGTWKQRIKSGLSFLLSHFTVLPLFSPCHSIFYPFS